MSIESRFHEYTMSSAADSYSELDGLGIPSGCLVTIDVSVAATSTPTGALSLEKYEIDGWATYDTGDEAFTDPAAGAAVSKLRMSNMEAGRYRIFYDSSSGGAAGGITARIRVGPAA